MREGQREGEIMLRTYKATLRGNYVEWKKDVPAHLAQEKAIGIYITVLDEVVAPSVVAQQGQRMADALEKLATADALRDIADPAAWERKIRQDRPLPGRSERC